MSLTTNRFRIPPPSLILHYWVSATIVLGMAFPLVWMIYSSMKTKKEIFRTPFSFPGELRFEHFYNAWVKGNMGTLYFNSLFITGTSVAIVVLLACLAAFAFARLQFPGRDYIFYVFIIGLLLPQQVVVLPLFVQLREMDLLDTPWALIFPYSSWALALTIYLLRAFFMTLPKEVEEAAFIDGASLFRTFWSISLPMVKPALITMCILNAINLWNELLLSLLFILDDSKRTLPSGLLKFYGYHNVNYSLVFSALSISTVPILILFFLTQKHIIKGLAAARID
ncbi:MAG: ABC transporter permease [Dehalococcoidales bacterium]|nr:ABC transporter permease [Dehalococcoidales bacterium]